jgi:hypothetical protein
MFGPAAGLSTGVYPPDGTVGGTDVVVVVGGAVVVVEGGRVVVVVVVVGGGGAGASVTELCAAAGSSSIAPSPVWSPPPPSAMTSAAATASAAMPTKAHVRALDLTGTIMAEKDLADAGSAAQTPLLQEGIGFFRCRRVDLMGRA